MVLNRRIGHLQTDEPKLTSHRRLMDTSTTTRQRWNFSGIPTRRESVVGIPTSGPRLPTSSEPTTHQKVRRILEEHALKAGERVSRNNLLSSTANFVGPGDDLGFGIRESPLRECTGSVRKRSPISGGQLVNGRGDQRNPWERRKDRERSNSRTRSTRNIPKSSSVPANLKDGLASSERADGGILKRSSVLLSKFNKDKQDSQLKRHTPLGTSRVQSVVAAYLRKSPSCQTLTADVHRDFKSGCRSSVKKSVSFSTDTSFSPKTTAAIHEARVYRKGVLRDVYDLEKRKKPPTVVRIEETMTQTLLRAAQDADELVLADVVARVRRCGLDQVDINATDSSGRSAISYMAGNGAAEMLEIVLLFPGANPNLPDNEGNTPLHFAAQAGQAECVNILLQRSQGIEIDPRNVLGFTPLMKAAIQGRTKCAKILLFAGANPTLRDHGRGLKAELWAQFCGRHVCADVIERFSRHRLMERATCRWGSEPELATKVLQGKIIPVSIGQMPAVTTGLKSKIKRVFKTSHSDRSFSLVSQLTNAALCASTPALPKPGDIPVKSLLRPLSVPQLRITLASSEMSEGSTEKLDSISKPPRAKKKNK